MLLFRAAAAQFGLYFAGGMLQLAPALELLFLKKQQRGKTDETCHRDGVGGERNPEPAHLPDDKAEKNPAGGGTAEEHGVALAAVEDREFFPDLVTQIEQVLRAELGRAELFEQAEIVVCFPFEAFKGGFGGRFGRQKRGHGAVILPKQNGQNGGWVGGRREKNRICQCWSGCVAMTVKFQQHPYHQREPDERRAAVTDERERDADDGEKAHRHAYVDGEVGEQDARDAIDV